MSSKCEVDRGGNAMWIVFVFSGTQESDSNGVVDDGPFPSSSNPRPNVELDTTVPPTVEVSEPIKSHESDGESSHDSPRVVSRYPQ